LKMNDLEHEITSSKLQIRNKISAIKQELDSYVRQNDITRVMVEDYETLVKAEERKFTMGESSLFLVNTRESKLIDAKLKAIELENQYFSTKALLFNSLIANTSL